MPASAAEAFAWHARDGAFERLAPPWNAPVLDSASTRPERGRRVELQVSVAPGIRVRWISEFTDVHEGESFKDVQLTGPFDAFEHTHAFVAINDDASVMEDRIHFAVPGGAFGDRVVGSYAERELGRIFRYRHRVLSKDLTVHRRARGRRLKVLVTGSTGLVGRALVVFLRSGGHEVLRLVRGAARRSDEIAFDPARGAAHPSELEGFDAVIHLAGEPIAEGRWNAEKKQGIRDSRVTLTRRLSETLAALKRPPAVFISASAIGYYGDRGDRILRESDAAGEGFLPQTCVEWEGATEAAAHAGIRVAHLRTGLVLTPAGGALQPMLAPFRAGVGGPLGTGNQWWSFITLDDLLYLIHHIVVNERVRGAVNAASPEAVTNAEFTRVLGRVLHRPAVFPVPGFALRLALGEMADPLVLASARVNPEKALDTGFEFAYPKLDQALGHVLGLP